MRFFACLLLTLGLAACATTARYVSLPEDGTPPARGLVTEGNLLRVVMNDGEQHEFLVQEVSDAGISGSPGFLDWQDIRSLQVVEQNGSKTAWAILAVIGAVAIAVLITDAAESALASSAFNCSGC